MRRAADKFEKEKAEAKRIEDEEAENARQSAEVYSAKLLQGAVRKSQARKKLRERCYKVFKKEFDPESFTFYYVDQRSVGRFPRGIEPGCGHHTNTTPYQHHAIPTPHQYHTNTTPCHAIPQERRRDLAQAVLAGKLRHEVS